MICSRATVSLLATLLICDLGFSRMEAVMLAVLFGVQLIFPSPEVRIAFALLYLAFFVALFIYSPSRRKALLSLLPRWIGDRWPGGIRE